MIPKRCFTSSADRRRRQMDAEAMPFADNSFDVVMSCVGAMFAPHHQAVADELVRVCRPGGTIGLINWTPEGFIGNLFKTMKPYAPPRRPVRAPHRCGETKRMCGRCSAAG